MTCAIEDSGFEIRDQIMWVYGQGFPKSLDISKALDKLLGAERQVVGQQYRSAGGRDEGYGFQETFDITAASSIAAQLWQGWGTGLKPSHEPICVARKPLAAKTVAENILLHGVGGINLDACRIPIDLDIDARQLRTMSVSQHIGFDGWGMNTTGPNPAARVLGEEGRWPANFIHDGSPEVIATFPPDRAHFFQQCDWRQDDLDAALFYYCAKASKKEKGSDNTHQTVKPLALARYLLKLICPPGGTFVDLFAGSGTFTVAGKQEGCNHLGFESDFAMSQYANARYEAA
jgi:site-specific DNA-methyltransferase (adenine-specific)